MLFTSNKQVFADLWTWRGWYAAVCPQPITDVVFVYEDNLMDISAVLTQWSDWTMTAHGNNISISPEIMSPSHWDIWTGETRIPLLKSFIQHCITLSTD